MHFITQKQLPRRTFLRGVGATVALPFLDAMLPARGGSVLKAAANSHQPAASASNKINHIKFKVAS